MLNQVNMNSTNFIYLLTFSFFFTTCLSAQITERNTAGLVANIQHYTVKDGLSHRQSECISRDRRGIIWVGTLGGLNRFDGKNFKVFYKKDGLERNNINGLYADGDVLWCFHHNEVEGLYETFSLFHTTKETVISLEEYLGYVPPFEKKAIKSVMINRDILIFQLEEGAKYLAYTFNPARGFRALPFVQTDDMVWGVTTSENYWIFQTNTENPALQQINAEGKINHHLVLPFLKRAYEFDIIYEAPNGTTWIRFVDHYNSGVFKVDGAGKVEMFCQSDIYDTTNTFDGSGIFQYYPQYQAFWYTNEDDNALIGLDGTVLFKTELNDTWVGQPAFLDSNLIWQPSENGVYQIELKENVFHSILANKNYQGFRAIVKLENNLYFHSYSGVFRSDSNGQPPYQKVAPVGLSSIKDRTGNLWISPYNALVKYDPKTEDTIHYEGVLAYEVWSLFEDKYGRIWYSQIGLHYLNPETGENIPIQYNGFQTLETSTVYHFYKKSEEEVLLCTTSGLYEMNIDKGITGRYWSGGKGKYYLPADDFRHIYFDEKKQSFWLAANQEGLIHWRPQDEQTEVFAFSHLAANTIHAIYPDDYGFLWLSTENGIIQFHQNTQRFKTYLPKDGTSSHEFNRISHFQDEDGTIYFGSINGITVFHPKDFQQKIDNLEKTSIRVVELNQYLAQTDNIENLTADFYENNSIDLYAGDRFFHLKLALTDYVNNSDAIYYYKIKNHDKDWSIATGNEISISGLPFGQQYLQIKALLPNGLFTEDVLEIPVLVRPPFYLTWWFLAIAFTVIVGSVWWFTRWRTQQLKIQKTLLEKEVQNRTAQIESDKKVIEEQAEKLLELDKTKSRFFANVSHELRTPITLIQGPIQSVINSQKLDNRNFTLLAKAKQNTQNLLALVNEILDLTKLEANKLELDESEVVFYTFLRRIISNFQSIADAKSIRFVFDYQLHEELQLELDKNKVEKILNNLLSNAFKFTPKNGRISVRVEAEKNHCLIKIQDNGRGIPKDDLPYVFNRFYQSSVNNKAEGGLGIGLALSMEFVKLMKGKMWVESQLEGTNKGSIFYLLLPKKEVMTMLPTVEKMALQQVGGNGFYPTSSSLNGLTVITNGSESKDSSKRSDTILLVEDNLDLREYIQFLLEPYYNVIPTENGQEALEQLTVDSQRLTADVSSLNHKATKSVSLPTVHRSPALIISDIMMPIMDGYEFLEHLKAHEIYKHLPIIMLTARAENKDRLRALRIGVDDYLIKPFDEEELLVRIENLLQNAQNRLMYQKDLVKENLPTNGTKKVKEKVQNSEFLEKLEIYILETIGKHSITAETIAQEMYISRTQLFQTIKAETGLTLRQYVLAIRLEKARTFLIEKKYSSVKEVAYAIGYKDTKTFSNNFKKRFGRLPSSFQ